jgi:dipeptidyl aminopeptidase/acylaminoacyl peptidase
MYRGLILVVAGALLAGCGKNQITVHIRGGDGNKVRLDANDVQFKFNHLVEAGTYTFPKPESKVDLSSGTYAVKMVAGDYLESRVLQLESPPLAGVQDYAVEFEIPAGSNAGFRRQGTILFAATSTTVRNWDLFTIRADGTELRQLTQTRQFEQHPSWSPDGRKILFTQGDVMTNFDIYAMDEDGGNVQRLTEHAERDQRASWSPDGGTIAFVSERDGDVAIWLMDANGANQRKLVKGREPSWSPDSRRIAFVSSSFHDNDEIYLIDADGGNMQRLTENKKFDWFPCWSPDGRRLVYNSEQFGGQELMLMKADGSAPTRITVAEHTYEQEPVWSPDGRGVAYAGKMTIGSDGELVVDDKGRPRGTYDIYVVEASGFDWDHAGARLGLPFNLTNTDDRDEVSPSWRPY